MNIGKNQLAKKMFKLPVLLLVCLIFYQYGLSNSNEGQEDYERGRHYKYGLSNFKKDDLQACDLFEKSASMNNKSGVYAFGMCFYLGNGREQDAARGLTLIKKASEMNYYKANYELAWIYLFDFANEELYESAFELLSRIENRNDADSHLILGTLYYQGKGVEKDNSKAVQHYSKAATLDKKAAQVLLSEIFKHGYYGQEIDNKKSNLYKALTQSAVVERNESLTDVGYQELITKFKKWNWLPK